ncbi:MAG: radical SAM protein, partial [Candidatus Nanoarchaeia archaeon]|nr:radical SAM protein [Candidatus Nanoarchaeia archaeon]
KQNVNDIDGFAYKEKGKVIVNPKTKLIQNLDELPYQARHLLPMEKYIKLNLTQQLYTKKQRIAQIITSRGCSARCVFCTTTNFWGNCYRMRSAKSVLDEIEFLIKEYNIEEIHFTDDNLTLDKQRARDIFNGMIERKFNVDWATPQGTAVWALDEEMLELMKKSGCYSLIFAIESGNQEVLHKIIKKPLNLKLVEPLVRKAKSLGIRVYSFFVVGLPGETKENIKETFKFAAKVPFDGADFSIATPLPGSELYEIVSQKGYLSKDFDFDNLLYHEGVISTPEFSAKELTELVERERMKYHLRIFKRDPIFFIKKYGKFFIEKPNVVLKRFMNQKLYSKLFGDK